VSSLAASAAPAWRSRITGTGTEAPDQLLAHPDNWRVHPKAQQEALAGVLDQVGWVQNVLVNQRTGHVVDGHLRVALAISRNEPSVPVVYVDLSPDEERLVLASLDPIAAMATTDEAKLRELLA
jgi:ParB-like chromosome segregation protein Spo0J